MQPLTSAEFASAVRNGIGPVAKQIGFTSTGKGTPAWSRNRGQDRISVSFRRHPNAVDPYQGGRFQFEFEHSTDEVPHVGLSGRAFFDQLLTTDERGRVLDHQNQVIASLRRPPASHVADYPESLRSTYLHGFEPQEDQFEPGTLWLRYSTLSDLEAWLRLIASMLPSLVERAERLDPRVLYLGSPIDLSASPLRPTNPVVLKRSTSA